MPAISAQQRIYAGKLASLLRGEDVTFKPAEFLIYVGHQNGMSDGALSARLGHNVQYMDNCLRTAHQALTKPLIAKVAYLTDTSTEFWSRKEFSSKDAEGIRFHPLRKAGDVTKTPIESYVSAFKEAPKTGRAKTD